MKFTVVHLLSVVTVLIGVAMILQAFAGGGGLGSYGVLMGAFFIAGGGMRLRLLRTREREGRE